MVNFKPKDSYSFEDLVEIMRLLRSENGCPWDREQTHESIRRNFIEEAYEAVEAIDKKDDANLCEELGDVLLQVVFHARIAEEDSRFDIGDVADGICKKLVLRHPHIFGDVSANTSKEVLRNWDEIKKVEKNQRSVTQAMRELPSCLPALIYADKLQSKAKKCGFDWPEVSGALDKLSEETEELRAAVEAGTNVEEELGDVLFSAVNVARFAHLDPEEALSKASQKFLKRFAYMEEHAEKPLSAMDLEEMDRLWNEAKTK